LLGIGAVANTLRFIFREQDRKDMIAMNATNDEDNNIIKEESNKHENTSEIDIE
jgi:hypothetical protein